MRFKDLVLKEVRKIKKGKVKTYKEIARLCGRPFCFRAVGRILNQNQDPKIPCHRVIRSDGRPGGYNRGIKRKIELLKKEGIKFKNLDYFSRLCYKKNSQRKRR